MQLNQEEQAGVNKLEATLELYPELKRLKKQLARKYPSHHYNHINVFSKFWLLVETLEEA